jgi:hypothetical protein
MRAPVKRRIRITDLDRNSSLQLLTVRASPDAGDGTDERSLTMIYVATSTDVALRLLRNAPKCDCLCRGGCLCHEDRCCNFGFAGINKCAEFGM